jgi:hypothetical protein
MTYTILGIVSTLLTIGLVIFRYYSNKKTSLDDVFKEEERKRQLRVLNNELKTLSVDSSDTVDELNRMRSSDTGSSDPAIGSRDVSPKK